MPPFSYSHPIFKAIIREFWLALPPVVYGTGHLE